jgi:microcystin degradation protein MlrC
MIGVDQALETAKRSAKPVCLLDMGDNAGGGSPADGTFLAHALDREKNLKSFVCLCDPESVEQAVAAGVGGRLRLEMGGKSDTLHGPPLEAEVRVRGIYAGAYTETEPRHGGGVRGDMGKTVVVETGRGLTLMLTSRRTGASSLQQLLSCGIAPGDFDVLVAKGVHSPVAAYQPVCPTLIRVNTPGVTAADMSRFSFRFRRRPLFPFEDCDWPVK